MSAFTALRGLPPSEWIGLFIIPSIWVLGVVPFAIRNALFGRPRTARLDKLAQNRQLFPRFILEYGYWMLNLPVRALVALGVSANAVTVMSGLLALGSAALCADGQFVVGGWVMFGSFSLDAMDGMVARLSGTSSDRGEFFDAFVDRYADFFCYLGFMWYYRSDGLPLALATLTLIGSSVMGYARAKGEACGIDPNVGWMQRHERGTIIGIATVLSPFLDIFVEPGVAHPRHYSVVVALGLVAVLANVTAIWRGAYVMRRMKQPVRHFAPAPAPDPMLTDGAA